MHGWGNFDFLVSFFLFGSLDLTILVGASDLFELDPKTKKSDAFSGVSLTKSSQKEIPQKKVCNMFFPGGPTYY